MRQLIIRMAVSGAASAFTALCAWVFAAGLPVGITAGITAGLTASLASSNAFAQQRPVPINPKAKRADITFDTSTIVLVNGKRAQLAPGVRILDRNNMLALYGSLQGSAKTKYLIEETTGNVIAIWILTDTEIATPDPASPK